MKIVTEIFSLYPRGFPLSPSFKQILVASGPLLSTVSLGMTSGYSAVLLPQLREVNATIAVSHDEESWIASMAVIPMAFGCIFGGFLMEQMGRKWTQILTTIPCFIGWLVIYFSMNIQTILIGRFLSGLCGGFLGPCTGVYISETSEPRLRSFLLGAISLAMALGLLIVHLLGTFLHWKTTALIACFLPIVSLAVLCLVPESPSWLAKKQKINEAQEAFYWCRGDNDKAKKEIAEIIDKKEKATEVIEYTKRQFLTPLIVITIFIVVNQWSGVNALTFYTVSIMQKTLSNGLNEYLAMIIVDLIRVIMSILACVIMKTVKRRPLALISGIGTCMSLFLLSGYTFLYRYYPNLESWYTIIPMVALIMYIVFITVGFVPLPWAMMGEVFPLNTRNVGSSITSFMAYCAFFTVVKTNPTMFDKLGVDSTFLLYGTVALFGTIINWFFLPETKDKTLNEIESIYKH